jgi:leucyl aminopeptidase
MRKLAPISVNPRLSSSSTRSPRFEPALSHEAPASRGKKRSRSITASQRATEGFAHRLALVSPQTERAALFRELGFDAPPAHLETHAALRGERGARLSLHGARSFFFYGVGAIDLFDEQEAADHGEACGQFLLAEGVREVLIEFPAELDHPLVNSNFLKGLGLAGLSYGALKTAPESGKTNEADRTKPRLTRVAVSAHGTGALSDQELEELSPLVDAIGFARILGDLPPAIASPQGIVDFFAAEAGPELQLEVWDEARIAREGMGLLQAVSRGSDPDFPPRFLIARYFPKGAGKPARKSRGSSRGVKRPDRPTLFWVGKGITFDTGGINLKTGDWQGLLSMRRDMCGAAAVLGAVLAASRIGLDVPIVAVTPLTTNSIGSRAVLPGDIIRSYAGKTVEIMNTDAEGRLILADALHYAVSQKADFIVDVATLTGACAVALGAYHSGLFANDDEFGQRVLLASRLAGEPAWPMPLSRRYGEELKSGLADLANMGKSRDGGAQLGAKFLENFVAKTPWAHLDIAGTHDIVGPAASGAGFKAAGRMVHTLVELARSFTLEK